jgi:cytochrome c oxidase subunit 2
MTLTIRNRLDLGLLAQMETWLFPEASSTTAPDVDRLFYFILFVCVVFFVGIRAAMLYFVVRYRNRHDLRPAKSPSHSNLLEIVWSVVPALLAAVIFVWGFFGYVGAQQPPEGSYEIEVIAKKWAWSFVYPNGYIDNNLHVPVDRPVRLTMSSDDVIHSLYVPAFRIKRDLVPGRYSKTWFEATEVGEYTLFCTEYCGTGHSLMNAKVVVHPQEEFSQWLEKAANFLDEMSPVEAGEVLYQRRGCAQCHSIDSSSRAGPTFLGAFGAEHLMADGETVTVDENYIRESILEPQAKIRSGYRPVMPSYQGQLSDREISALIQYIKSLK